MSHWFTVHLGRMRWRRVELLRRRATGDLRHYRILSGFRRLQVVFSVLAEGKEDGEKGMLRAKGMASKSFVLTDPPE